MKLFNSDGNDDTFWDELDKAVDEAFVEIAEKEKKLRCECGADTCKIPHSTWCPVYKKQKNERLR